MDLPVPTPSPQARWLSKKRAQARSAGLCSMCCKRHPDQGYAVCHTCKQRVHERRVRRRNFSLQHQVPKKHLNIAQDYEASGDSAVTRNRYVEATAFFERALDYSRSVEDEVRLCEKIGEAF